MATDDEEAPYRPARRGDVFVVVDDAKEVVLACGDETTAERYAVTLNQAWRRGYKAGYRAARAAR